MLGYLSMNGVLPVNGLKSDAVWQSSFDNGFANKEYKLFPIPAGATPCSDPQHDRQSIATQIGTAASGQPSMGGFVESYVKYSDPVPTEPGAVMGYFEAASVPTFDFFAKHYCVCDHWFSSLPLGTQANRLMAMAGESLVLDNAPVMLPDQDLVYDWLTLKDIPWRAYQSGDFLPFFSLMPSWLPEIASSLTLSQMGLGVRFRRYTQFADDWRSVGPMPKVVFIEPEYTDGPHSEPNDDHAPTGIQPGQEFLADIYNTLISNPSRWATTMLVITYDEHGGFFDHVTPLKVPSSVCGADFITTGVRVPAFVVSPFVGPGSVFSQPLDHTSILQLLDDRFVSGEGYSVAVNERQRYFDRILNVLTPEPRSGLPVQLTISTKPKTGAPTIAPTAPHTANAQALHVAAHKIADEHPELLRGPGWEKLNAYLASSPPPLPGAALDHSK